MYGRVIDDLAHLRCSIWGGGHFRLTVLRGASVRGRNFTKLWEDITGDHRFFISLFQNSDILLHFLTRAAQSRVMSKMTQKFALFDPCEI